MELIPDRRTINWWKRSLRTLRQTRGEQVMKTPTKGTKEQFPPGPRDEDATLVVLDSESYVQFESWMDGELDRLVARWIHAAAPNANRPSLLRNRDSQS